MAPPPDEKTYVENPFIVQLKGLGWEHIEGDIDVPNLTEQDSFREVLLRNRLARAPVAIKWLDQDERHIQGMKDAYLTKGLRWRKRLSGFLLIVLSITVGFPILLPVMSVADVVVFKDGRKMNVEKAWVEGSEVKAEVCGGVVGYPRGSVERIEEDQTRSTAPR
jgi:hypothetical protein